ncbi:hypothetical protein L202_01314 [Cryptococcus amylolentus CBS 6039]|uniref:Uncharacterized protein n=1 Tax=Cryptococcus amylolentus CBS 6039 TaxID=1295533 RepID=A0A1E3I3B5_9TREE|nr:hypothetical protein L202_01314 [Cryptococcus amylolentus CBS 6039]ODN83104.1 hypothetical protein L202_01314 [Cryptococcus amylolentus CBS 6039]
MSNIGSALQGRTRVPSRLGTQLDVSKATDMFNVFTEDLAQETSFGFSTEGKVWDLQETDEVDEEEVLELLEMQHPVSDSSLA